MTTTKLPATGPYVDRIIRIFRDKPDDDTSALVLVDYAEACRATAPAVVGDGVEIALRLASIAITRAFENGKVWQRAESEDRLDTAASSHRADLAHRDLADAIRAFATRPAVADGFYLATFKQPATYGQVLWWQADNRGYTPDLEQAGIYTDLIPGYHDSDDTVPVPAELIDRLRVRRIVDYGDSLNTQMFSAKQLRAWLAPAPRSDDLRWRSYVDAFVGPAALSELRKRFEAGQ